MRLLTTQDGLPRISWGSVIAGVILSLIAYLVLTVLGTAIGASVLSPFIQPDSSRSFAFGSGAYMIVMTVIAVFVGSYFAGRCAPVLGWLHGLLAWGVMIIVMAYGATSLVGSAVSAAGSVAATGATATPAATPPAAGGSMLNSLKAQVQGAVASAAAQASSPQAEADDARQMADTAARGVARASWFSFAALVVGAIIALVSGNAGFRHQPPFEDEGGSARGDLTIDRRRRPAH
ncbi:glucan phosphoethanolaminetransferase (alkaline phosphatase superfamily) [Paraburkholderia sp. GAS199]|uniref:YrzE family protein n=1 Tax=Paraburkholderia sp. GAS199 TaxID=3035126 RepID=UPI003D258CDF